MPLTFFFDNLEYINFAAWFLAAVTIFILFKKSVAGWKYILAGSLLMVVRQIIKLLPAYESSEAVFISRYAVGAVAAVILFLGFLSLYKETKE